VVVNAAVKGLIEQAQLAKLGGAAARPAAAAAAAAAASASPAAASAPAHVMIPYEELIFERSRRGDRVELGRAAFASVYAATFRGERVAVKALALPPGADAAAAERALLAEATVHFRVRHAGVVPLLGVCVERDAPGGPPTELALVMPRLARSLESALAAGADSGDAAGGGGGGGPPLAERLGWLRDVARALRFLHASGIVHGDLKPANVLLDAGGRALVCDFGHARLRGDDAAASTSLGGGGGGTPRYRDPAFAAGRSALRKASDVYSLGILAWQVLTGRVPYAGMDVAPLLAHVAAGGRPDADALPAALPVRARHLILQSWLDAQRDRPTAAAVCDMLGAGDV
jgi:mitogen-activated protein kinase kinase kinase MLK4